VVDKNRNIHSFLEPTFIGNIKTVCRKLPKPVALRVKFLKVGLKISNWTIFGHFTILRHMHPECQHIFGKQTGYICTFSVSLIWAPKNNNKVVDK
jgi:hypothetical protein